ncbi:hypothetical protein [Thalassospira xiamenensis]|uniref:hypothetical protein n=1 Tax=Thalassospira xiamenensis TaxID=220697 RepID=UPI000DEE03A8|nr:hypothetical protein [Thalassospira xiamenensis]RCK40475.1 hypothetical protein TH24_11100 [Thalassospira xiamenensis]
MNFRWFKEEKWPAWFCPSRNAGPCPVTFLGEYWDEFYFLSPSKAFIHLNDREFKFAKSIIRIFDGSDEWLRLAFPGGSHGSSSSSRIWFNRVRAQDWLRTKSVSFHEFDPDRFGLIGHWKETRRRRVFVPDVPVTSLEVHGGNIVSLCRRRDGLDG